MFGRYAVAFFLVISSSIGVLNASAGDADPRYRSCVRQCEETGYCKFSSDEVLINHPRDMLESLYVQWKKWNCQSDCRYNCILDREKERELFNDGPVKYHGKWPFKRIYGIQEPASVAFSALNLAMHFYGWKSFFTLLKNKFHKQVGKKASYEYAVLWHIFGLLSVNSWFWSAVFHTRDFELSERLDYSSAVALIGYSLILAMLRSFNVRDEATRVMLSAPLIAFVITHILFLNVFKLDYGWNMKVCVAMAVAQLTIWQVWGFISRHPSRWKLRFVVLACGLAMLLEIYDFPPYQGLIDAHALWHATTIPLTYLWWSFIKDDAEFLTSKHVKKSKKSK
ncbi:uncharacterized protein LOC133317250 isoform X1 [Gastrolobium bilobum]|uniref:uncharacterized protein LOC133317250 isoform X1 n=1 Tax=Gastrolobium bilobum TaxID=150636 RepID=UPI002AAFF725|nr:uncharacterized protein LOC133317250 isoform X1 [Gastrolobium bilobum]